MEFQSCLCVLRLIDGSTQQEDLKVRGFFWFRGVASLVWPEVL